MCPRVAAWEGQRVRRGNVEGKHNEERSSSQTHRTDANADKLGGRMNFRCDESKQDTLRQRAREMRAVACGTTREVVECVGGARAAVRTESGVGEPVK